MALAMGLAVVACAQNGASSPEIKELTPSKAEVDSVSYLLGINFGSFMKSYDFGTKVNYSEIVKGIKDFINSEGTPSDSNFVKQFKVDPNEMTPLFNSFLEKRHNIVLLENKAKAEKFLAENAAKDGVQVTESGLQYKVIEAGNDVKPAAVDTVWVKYKGTLADGTVFDQTEESDEPIEMVLNRVIPGWTEGLQLRGEGGKIQLVIPSDLGYGENGNQVIPANSVLCFDVELAKVGKVAVEEDEVVAE